MGRELATWRVVGVHEGGVVRNVLLLRVHGKGVESCGAKEISEMHTVEAKEPNVAFRFGSGTDWADGPLSKVAMWSVTEWTDFGDFAFASFFSALLMI